MKKEGNYNLVPIQKIAVNKMVEKYAMIYSNDKDKYEDSILEELEFELFKAYKKFLSSIDSSNSYFVMGEAVISEDKETLTTTIKYTAEAWIYAVQDIPARTSYSHSPVYELGRSAPVEYVPSSLYTVGFPPRSRSTGGRDAHLYVDNESVVLPQPSSVNLSYGGSTQQEWMNGLSAEIDRIIEATPEHHRRSSS